jgi:hypothetical protein
VNCRLFYKRITHVKEGGRERRRKVNTPFRLLLLLLLPLSLGFVYFVWTEEKGKRKESGEKKSSRESCLYRRRPTPIYIYT